MRRTAAVGVVVAAVAAAAAWPASGAALTGASPGFGEPTASGIQGNGFEQDLRVDNPHNVIYTSAPQSLSSATSIIWRSTDGGLTFKEIPGQIPPAGKPLTCVGGGDSELGVDSGGHLYFNDLTLLNFSVARSDDRGKTFSAVNCAGVPDTAVDRQWYATYGDATGSGYLGLAYDRLLHPNTAVCTGVTDPSSVGNVLSLNLSFPGVAAGEQFGPAQTVSCDEGIMGNDEMHNYGGSSGLKIFVVHDNAALNSVSMGRCDVVGISFSARTGFANCHDFPIASFPGYFTGANFPTMSVDSGGNLFAVWEEAPGTTVQTSTGPAHNITGNTQLFYAMSTTRGATWSTPVHLPTPGLNQDLFAWPAAGDPGRIDVAFYGAPEAWAPGDTKGPDSIDGHYGLYMAQTINNGATWTVTLASEHFIHRGTVQTLIGDQSGNRTLGDFLQLRLGSQGQAMISYSDSNNIDSAFNPEAMFVQQNTGPGLYLNNQVVSGPPAPSGNCVTDPPRDATFDALGNVSANNPNLDLRSVCMSKPDATHYRVTMTVSDLRSLLGSPNSGAPNLIWQTQWHVPSTSDANGGALFMVYMESYLGGTPTCWVGQNASEAVGGGVELTYPGSTQLTGSACAYTATAPGTITITVPTADVREPNPVSDLLFSVTGSTQTTPLPAESTPSFSGIGGQPPNLIDVTPAFDFGRIAPPVQTPEAPWVPILGLTGAALAAVALRRQRGRPDAAD